MALAYTAIAVEAAGSNDGASTTVSTVAQAFTAGQHAVVFVNGTAGTIPTVPTCADTAGNTWTYRGTINYSDNWIACFTSMNITGHATNVVTVTFGGGLNLTYRRIHCLRFSGAATTAVEGSIQTGTTPSGTAIASGNVTLTGNGAVAGGVATYNTAGAYTAGSGQTEASSDDYLHSQYRIAASGGSYANNGTVSSTDINLIILGIGLLETPASGTTYTFTVSGGVTFGGTNSFTRTKILRQSGGVSFGGTAPYTKNNIIPVSGGILFSGTSPQNRTKVLRQSGGVLFSGTNPIIFSREFIFSVSGGILFSGAPSYQRERKLNNSGGIIFGGTAQTVNERALVVSGGIIFSGNNVFVKEKILRVFGGVVFSGQGAMIFIPNGTPPTKLDYARFSVGVGRIASIS